MHWETLLVGVAVLGFGVFLVASHGYIGSTYLPGLIGLPAPSSGNATSPFSSFGGYGVGTILCLSGLGMVGAGLRTPGRPKLGAAGAGMPPELMAALGAMRGQMPPTGVPASQMSPPRVCPSCGAPNFAEAMFCQKCAAPLGAMRTQAPAPVVQAAQMAAPRGCPSCAAPNGSDAIFCQKCGARLAPASSPPPLPTPRSGSD